MPSRPSPDFFAPAAIAVAAAAYAAAELLLAVTLGGFFVWGRAEALLFLAWRPWLLIAAAALASGLAWRRRLAFYVSALLLAGLCESLFLTTRGSDDPWPEMLRGLGAAAIVLIATDLLVQAGRRRLGRAGTAAASAAAALLLLVPALRIPYDAVAIGPGDGAPAVDRPVLLLMTSLPIVWGERGAFDPASHPSETHRALQEEYEVRPIDVLDDASLGRGRLLLLAQPRWLAPAELVSLDAWLRRGGRALILADPALSWPSDLPLGDVRRPVPVSLLGPLLAHWGLELRARPRRRDETIWAGAASHPPGSKLLLQAPGRFVGGGGECHLGAGDLLAYCRIGRGKATLIADADLLRDDVWTAQGPDGGARHRRTADNPLAVAELLDMVAGVERERVRRPVAWVVPGLRPVLALPLALLPAILVACAGLLLRRRCKFRPQGYPQADKA